MIRKTFKTYAQIPYQEIINDVREWDAVDDIVDFIMACITDDEIAEAVIHEVRLLYPSAGREDV